jgi:hypothetical protein
MDLEDRIWAAADALALKKGHLNDVHVADVARAAEVRIQIAGAAIKKWRIDRSSWRFSLPPQARKSYAAAAEQIFILGILRGLHLAGRKDVGPGRSETAQADRPSREPRPAASADKIENRCLTKAVWRTAANPHYAKAAALALRRIGHPLGHEQLNAAVPGSLQFKPPRHPWRDVPDALRGARLSFEHKRWWFTGEERPPLPGKKKQLPARTNYANSRKIGRELFDAALDHLRAEKRAMAVSELREMLIKQFGPFRRGSFTHDWLRLALYRRAETDPQLARVGPKFRWKKRPRR